MSWIFFAIISYFFSALSQIVDKILLRARLPSSATYAFYTGISSILVIILLPFGVSFLPFSVLLLALLSGIVFVPAIYLLFISLRRCDVSRIVPIIGGAIPIFLLLISFVWSGQLLGARQLIAVLLFVVGGLILTIESEHSNLSDSFVAHILGVKGKRLKICNYETGKGIIVAMCSAFFFALTYFLSKQVYEFSTPFLSEFFWIRIGSVLSTLCMLLIPIIRQEIFATTYTISKSSASIIFGNKVIGAGGFFFLNISFSVASNQNYIVIINAMKGLEHFFIFIFSFFLTIFFPHLLYEEFDYHSIILKLAGITFIGFGFIYLI
ncbi:MAG: hypothetical protein AAB795_03485 [Patescibacteria group bacterium]